MADVMNGIYDRLTSLNTTLAPALNVAGNSVPALEERAGDEVDKVSKSLLAARDALDTNVITPLRLEMPWPEFDKLMTQPYR